MLGLLLAASLMSVGGDDTRPARDVDTWQTPEVQELYAQAQRDFEQRHQEKGLLGSAPLAGLENARSDAQERTPAARTEAARVPASQSTRTP